MKFRKLIPLLLVCILLVLTACSNGGAEVKSPTTEITTVSETATEGISATEEESIVLPSDKTIEQATTKKAVSTETTTKATSTTTTKKQEGTSASISTTKATTNQTTTKPTTKATTTTTKPQTSSYCTLTIECKEILNNMSELKEGHEAYVPNNGYILSSYKVKYESGDTAYDILKKGCKEKGIKLTAKSTSYGTYVSGINNLDEFDCGKQSGWLYSVNSKFPSISCSKQKVEPNDAVTFKYTCKY